jgi:adenylate cyclase
MCSPSGLTDRGSHALKGKSAPIEVFGLDPAVSDTPMLVIDTASEQKNS